MPTNTFAQLGVNYVDLYLIHSPRLALPDIATSWKQMEKLKADGFAKCAILHLYRFGIDAIRSGALA